ncbi:TerC family protein [Candidatus Paracaedibacter symbiosus]|uniref:TerC family protein n=1 Tax=Candidatus Paracaedibacter symbiosus TaxID=244582 RepID=UPI001E2DB91E|nr:TerC family protein [Candidatus Paracaedibacter symbiosus]
MIAHFIESSWSTWGVFFVLVFTMLTLDLGVLNKKQHEMGIKKSLSLSLFYICVGLSFSLWIYYVKGGDGAEDYLTGYLVEKSLSLDNIFVISLIFSAFQIPQKYQHRVLFWGILGVLILRGIMIALGVWLIHQFEWVTYIFAAFLIITGIKMLCMKETEHNIQDSSLFKFFSAHLRITPILYEEKFIVRLPDPSGKKLIWVTPLFLVLLIIEAADLVFAVDSVPAIFSITDDPYVVYTSNIFAILGLRSLYFALSTMMERFSYLKYALALILIFIGAKVLAVLFLPIEKVPSLISLLVTILLLAGGIVTSVIAHRKG